jgi:hypothetical protein
MKRIRRAFRVDGLEDPSEKETLIKELSDDYVDVQSHAEFQDLCSRTHVLSENKSKRLM